LSGIAKPPEGFKNLTPNSIKLATSWEQAKYDPEFREQLGLPPKFTP
jgi:hypothetical protein